MKNRIIFVLLVFILCCCISSYAEENTKELFEQKCSKCHDLSRPLSEHNSRQEWQNIVIRMRNKKPEWISMDEAGMISAYLAEIRGEKSRKIGFGVISGILAFISVISVIISGMLMMKGRAKPKTHHRLAGIALIFVLVHAIYMLVRIFS